MSEFEKLTLKPELLALSDEFAVFNDYCSFLCDAMSALCHEYRDSEPDINALMGARRHFSWLKYKTEELKNELDRLYERPYTDPNVTKLKSNS